VYEALLPAVQWAVGCIAMLIVVVACRRGLASTGNPDYEEAYAAGVIVGSFLGFVAFIIGFLPTLAKALVLLEKQG
jgi:hypothetical protein